MFETLVQKLRCGALRMRASGFQSETMSVAWTAVLLFSSCALALNRYSEESGIGQRAHAAVAVPTAWNESAVRYRPVPLLVEHLAVVLWDESAGRCCARPNLPLVVQLAGLSTLNLPKEVSAS